jgi:hypothetical protein
MGPHVLLKIRHRRPPGSLPRRLTALCALRCGRYMSATMNLLLTMPVEVSALPSLLSKIASHLPEIAPSLSRENTPSVGIKKVLMEPRLPEMDVSPDAAAAIRLNKKKQIHLSSSRQVANTRMMTGAASGGVVATWRELLRR